MAATTVARFSVTSRSSSVSFSQSRQAAPKMQTVLTGMKSVSLTAPTTARRGVPVGRKTLQIQAARIGGVDVPNQKRVETSLTYIFGIGPTTAKAVLRDTGVENKRVHELNDEELSKLRGEVENYMIEGDLRRFNLLAIKRLVDIQCYRGRRHSVGLPCRGQHTKNNARTLKGKKIAIAGKKKPTMR